MANKKPIVRITATTGLDDDRKHNFVADSSRDLTFKVSTPGIPKGTVSIQIWNLGRLNVLSDQNKDAGRSTSAPSLPVVMETAPIRKGGATVVFHGDKEPQGGTNMAPIHLGTGIPDDMTKMSKAATSLRVQPHYSLVAVVSVTREKSHPSRNGDDEHEETRFIYAYDAWPP